MFPGFKARPTCVRFPRLARRTPPNDETSYQDSAPTTGRHSSLQSFDAFCILLPPCEQWRELTTARKSAQLVSSSTFRCFRSRSGGRSTLLAAKGQGFASASINFPAYGSSRPLHFVPFQIDRRSTP